jgi:hypothetical protein
MQFNGALMEVISNFCETYSTLAEQSTRTLKIYKPLNATAGQRIQMNNNVTEK